MLKRIHVIAEILKNLIVILFRFQWFLEGDFSGNPSKVQNWLAAFSKPAVQ